MLRQFKDLTPPAKWLITFIALVLGLSFLFAPRSRPVDLSEITFTTTSSSELYFKNIRSYYYDIYDREKAPFVIYRLKRRNRDTTELHLQFMIVSNPLANEAYIFAEPSPAIKQYDSLAVFISKDSDSTVTAALLSRMINEDHYLFAGNVFEKLLNGGQTFLINEDDTLAELFTGNEERRNAETVLEDYFKLVNKN